MELKKLSLFVLFGLFSLITFSQTVIYSEDFDSLTVKATTYSSGVGTAWGLCSTFQNGGASSDSAKVSTGDTLFLQTDTINTSAYSFLSFEFSQICKIDFFDKAIIQFSTDSGLTWNQLRSADYNGSGTLLQNAFSSISYTDWLVSNSAATPTQLWWKSETFNLDAAAGFKNVIIRFALIDADNNGAVGNYGWLLDDLIVTGSNCELVAPSIQLTGILFQTTTYQRGPYKIEATITDASGIFDAFIVYQKNSGPPDTVTMINVGGDIFEGFIPLVSVNDTICYLVYAIDSSLCRNLGVLQVASCVEFIYKLSPAPACVGATIVNYDYTENLSGFTAGNGRGTVGTLKSNWRNATGDDHNWWVYDRATRSRRFGTGPAADHSTNDNKYLYVEASGHNNETANLITPCFNLSTLINPQYSFWYHMYGSAIGELHFDVFFGGQWVLDIIPMISGNQGDVWKRQLVDLTSYAGNTVKFRFRGITGGTFSSDIAIDDFELIELAINDIELAEILLPSKSACSAGPNEPVTVRIKNQGTTPLDTIPLAYQVNSGSIIIDTSFASIFPGDSLDFTFSQTYNMSVAGNYNVKAWAVLLKDDNNINDSILNYNLSTASLVSVYPDTTDFDNFVVGSPGTLLDSWENRSDDNYDWNVNDGPTPTSNTGPMSDHTSGSGNYLYAEADGVLQGNEAKLESKCYDISNLNQPELSFYYHMLGTNMGSLHLDILVDGILTEDIITPISGNKGSSWIMETVNLNSYVGNIKLIFRAERGNGNECDIALDDVMIRDLLPVGLSNIDDVQLKLTVFPNPTNGYLYVDLLNDVKVLQVIMFDPVGKLVYQSNSIQNGFKIDMSSMENGIYFIRFQTSLGIVTKKIIKQ